MIVALPPVMPVTTPVVLFTVAFEVLLLVHVPPVIALLSVVVYPGQIKAAPVFDGKAAFIVTSSVL